MPERPFVAPAHRYALNTADGETVRAVAAVLNQPSGDPEPGVMVHAGQNVRLVIPTADAVRLANQIADIALTQRIEKA
ncbi:hypothetical protein [Microbacterium sp.]|uniref:hypothetical protein n=1 Tax=Microbacterium sp. TaxID=51671 RepID=UPI0028126B23|nr:hypothetical protein [Microbacterium sp.]